MNFKILILLLVLLSGCGIFKKNKTRNEFKDESVLIILTDSVSSKVDTSKVENSEKIEIIFKLKPVGLMQIPGDSFKVEIKRANLKTVDRASILNELINHSEEIRVTVDKKTMLSTGIHETLNTKTNKVESNDIEKVDEEKIKDANTTFAANIPVIAWVIGGIVVFLSLIFLVKYLRNSPLGFLASREPP